MDSGVVCSSQPFGRHMQSYMYSVSVDTHVCTLYTTHVSEYMNSVMMEIVTLIYIM